MSPHADPDAELLRNAKSAFRALKVLQFLASRARPTAAMTIARECDLPKSSAYHLLNVMRAQNFVTYYPEERAWGLGIAAFELGSAYLRSKPLERLGLPVLHKLGDATGIVAHLGVLHGNETLILAKHQPETRGPALVTQIGVRLPAHLTGVGRAMLMSMSPAQFHALYPAGAPLVLRTNRGPRLRIELERELAAARRRGWADEDGLISRGIACIAAPVHSHEGRPLAAVSVSFVRAQHPGDEWPELAGHVQAAAAELATKLGYHPSVDADDRDDLALAS
jgi:DNA-binding IclR family transcriptional regulator